MTERRISWESIHLDNIEKDSRETIADRFREENPDDEEGTAEEIESLPVLMDTPLGPVFLDDKYSVFRQIEHRVCHTNFDVTEREMIICNAIPGVETLSVVSRYRLLIGFAKLFDGSEVRRNIERILINIEDYPESLYRKQAQALRMFD